MIDRLPAWLFLSIAMILNGLALIPILRYGFEIDKTIGIQPLTVVMLLIGGLMSGLSAMILLVRRQPNVTDYKISTDEKRVITLLHSSGFLLFTGIPLANFLMAYWLWIKHRHTSEIIDQQGIESLNFQITIYLYILLSLFLAFVVIGLFFIPIILLIHFVLTLSAVCVVISAKTFTYPLNIPIIQGRPTKD